MLKSFYVVILHMKISFAKIVNNIYSPKMEYLLFRAKELAENKKKQTISGQKAHKTAFANHI